ncbi:PQQ enzyme repeat protein [Rubripirellula tenax]|uniref:PQQ enzyme repeat protein n=1 Tax=Rubripirellula tenax TaxID=2528015 RepID=A0A5C6FG09_9BACT|nr:PQQ-binding-like beta-propeller repeat protein [Rubripirellula tenax]TWU59056.1 PQQ enzyme repeat protein [Rubripirellula tenax]
MIISNSSSQVRSQFWVAGTLGVIAVIAGILSPASALAQGFLRPITGAQSGRFIEPPRAIEQQLRDADRALGEKRYSDAVVALGDLLSRDAEQMDESDLTGQDFFLGADEAVVGTPLQMSLFRAAREMIASLPSAAMETYELRYGSIAKKSLIAASENRDWEQVREVRRRFFHTRAGYEASWLLAQREIYSGHPLAASVLLDDVVTHPGAIKHLGNGVTLLHASACRLADRNVPELGVGVVTLAGKEETIPATDDQVNWLARHSAQLPNYAAAETSDYPMFGSTPSRNGGSAGQLPLTNLRWMLNTTASPRQERTLRDVANELTTSGKLPPPTWMPIRVGEQLLMRTTERLVGVDYRTGKRLWTYPWQTAFETAESEDVAFDELTGEDDASDLLTQRVWNDVPYGQVTSDGERVFMLSDLGEVEMASLSPMINLRGTRPADTSTNTLVALEMATEGKLLWRLGSGADENSPLSDAFFLGPPLPVDGRLYVMAEIAGDINLSCLDPATGKEIWRQHLVAVESGGIDTDPIRRIAGAMPTYHEGVLVCPTGAGSTVAIDLGDRMLRWGMMYERNTEMVRAFNGRGAGMDASHLMQRWDNGTAIAEGQTVLVTPIEADRLFGFDLLSGRPLFPEKNRVEMRYLAGIRDGHFLVVGSNQVRAFAIDENGTNTWTTRDLMTAGQQTAGRGVFGDGNYLVPTTTNQLVLISLDDGSVIERRNTRYPLGNLVAIDGEVIVQSPTALSVAFGEATLEPIVNRMLSENPDDFEALVRKSELLIQRNQRSEALELLERARQMQPDNDEVQMLSVSAMLGLLRDDAEVDPGLVEALEALIDRPAQRAELMSLRIRTSLSNGSYVEAAQRLIDFSTLVVSEPMLESVSDQVINDPSRQCTMDSWLAARSAEIANSASADDLAKVNQLLSKLMESRRQSSTTLVDRIYHHFRPFDGVKGLRDELIDRYQSTGEFLKWERLILGSRVASPQSLESWSAEDKIGLARLYAEARFGRDAVAILDATSNDESESPEIASLRKVARASIGVPQWPNNVDVSWDSRQIRTRFGSNAQRLSKTQVLMGEQFQGWQLISDAATPLALRDPSGVPRMIPIETMRQGDDIDKEAMISGGAMLVLMPSGLVLVDLNHVIAGSGESLMWQRNLSGDGSPIANRRGIQTPFGDQVIHYHLKSTAASKVIPEFSLGPVIGDRVLMLQGGDLVAIDLISKETLWRNSTAPKSGVVLSDGTRCVVVSSATSEVVSFDLLDGRRLDRRPWPYGEVWEAAGSHVLAYRQLDDEVSLELSLVNPLTDQVLLSETTYSSNGSGPDSTVSYGQIVDGRYLALMRSRGESLLWDLVTGQEIGRPKLPDFDDMKGFHAMRLRDQMIFLPKRQVDRPRTQTVEQLQTADGAAHQTAHGVYAVSMDDGAVRWGQEFEKPWGCTLTQAADTPILLLTRSPFTYSIPSRKKYLDVLALDVLDGKPLFEKSGKPILSGNNELEVRLTVQEPLGQVIAQIGPEMLAFKFGLTENPASQPSDQTQPATEPEDSPALQ